MHHSLVRASLYSSELTLFDFYEFAQIRTFRLRIYANIYFRTAEKLRVDIHLPAPCYTLHIQNSDPATRSQGEGRWFPIIQPT